MIATRAISHCRRLPALAGNACTSPWLACKLTSSPNFDNFEARQWTD
jgi:hypothetical protein